MVHENGKLQRLVFALKFIKRLLNRFGNGRCRIVALLVYSNHYRVVAIKPNIRFSGVICYLHVCDVVDPYRLKTLYRERKKLERRYLVNICERLADFDGITYVAVIGIARGQRKIIGKEYSVQHRRGDNSIYVCLCVGFIARSLKIGLCLFKLYFRVRYLLCGGTENALKACLAARHLLTVFIELRFRGIKLRARSGYLVKAVLNLCNTIVDLREHRLKLCDIGISERVKRCCKRLVLRLERLVLRLKLFEAALRYAQRRICKRYLGFKLFNLRYQLCTSLGVFGSVLKLIELRLKSGQPAFELCNFVFCKFKGFFGFGNSSLGKAQRVFESLHVIYAVN